MRYATVHTDSGLTGARVDGERTVLLDVPDALAARLAGESARETGESATADTHFVCTSPTTQHILCIGLNYRTHIEQLGRPMPDYPAVFAKFPSTLTGPRDRIALPMISERVQGEVELTVVIGEPARRLATEQAATVIAGYTIANDVSLRDWQHRTGEALQGKVADRTTPIGPFLVTPDEADDAMGLELTLTVDDVTWQKGNTSDMLFRPAALVAYCSTFLTLQPGDLILTGTPGTTSAAADLSAGSVMTTSIEGLGAAVNPLTRETDAA